MSDLPDRIARVREDVAAALALVDELFPEDPRPARTATCPKCGWPFARTMPACDRWQEHGGSP